MSLCRYLVGHDVIIFFLLKTNFPWRKRRTSYVARKLLRHMYLRIDCPIAHKMTKAKYVFHDLVIISDAKACSSLRSPPWKPSNLSHGHWNWHVLFGHNYVTIFIKNTGKGWLSELTSTVRGHVEMTRHRVHLWISGTGDPNCFDDFSRRAKRLVWHGNPCPCM